MNKPILNKLTSLTDIPNDLKYEGYYWLSNKSKPVVLQDELFEYNSNTINPFIIEGHFYCNEKNISISIKQLDGKYLINQITWCDNVIDYTNNSDNLLYNIESYNAAAVLGHGIKKLTFIRYWEEKETKNCENMNVLTPSFVGFFGFEKGDNND